MTLGTQWAWKPDDAIKTVPEVVRILANCAGGDGNLLLNVGPMPDGRIEPRQAEVLRGVGAWLKTHGESIYGTRGGPWKPGGQVASTRRDNRIYLHLIGSSTDAVTLPAPGRRITSARLLGSGRPVEVAQHDGRITIAVAPAERDPVGTVVCLDLDGSAMDLPAIDATVADAPPASDYRVTKVRILPAAGHAGELKGAKIVGSLTSATNDFEDIATIDEAPAENAWIERDIPADRARAFRFVKLQARNDTAGAVAEIELHAGGRTLGGTPFGTTGSGEAENDPKRAFDGDPATAFRGASTFGQYVGLDLGPNAQVARPTFAPGSGTYPDPQAVTITGATPGATVVYAIDPGGRPGLDAQGQPAGGARISDGSPVRIDKSSILQAVAIKPGLAESPTVLAAYRIGADAPAAGAVAEFHIGNSLTDTVNPWMEPLAASAGRTIRYYRFTIPGAPTDWLWDHPGSGFGETQYAEAFLARAPLTDLVTQPFAGHGRSIDNEAEYSGRFFDLARKYSPDVQMWLYVQWPGLTWDRDRWAHGHADLDGKEATFGTPAKTWQEAAANHVRYTEQVRARMNQARADDIAGGRCKPVKIIPAGLALARLKDEIEAGRVPGLTDFAATVFPAPDDIHMTAKGAYLVALVHYACLYDESPDVRVTAAGSGLTPEQARIFQRIAWETVREYAKEAARRVAPGDDQ